MLAYERTLKQYLVSYRVVFVSHVSLSMPLVSNVDRYIKLISVVTYITPPRGPRTFALAIYSHYSVCVYKTSHCLSSDIPQTLRARTKQEMSYITVACTRAVHTARWKQWRCSQNTGVSTDRNDWWTDKAQHCNEIAIQTTQSCTAKAGFNVTLIIGLFRRGLFLTSVLRCITWLLTCLQNCNDIEKPDAKE